jgi:hypothetical protein
LQIGILMRERAFRHARIVAAAALLAAGSAGAAKNTILWKPVENAILQVDSKAPKVWNVFQPGKKIDPLLVQIGNRYLVVYAQNMMVYELKADQFQRKGDDLVWREEDKPAKPLATSDWSEKDVGSATRVIVKLSDEGHLMIIEIPKMPDLRGPIIFY